MVLTTTWTKNILRSAFVQKPKPCYMKPLLKMHWINNLYAEITEGYVK